MKKSVIAVMLSVVITPAAYADSYSYTVDQAGTSSALTNTSTGSIHNLTPNKGQLTLHGSDDHVIDLDQIKGNLELLTDHQNQITDNRIAISDNAKDIADNKTNIDNNALAIHNTDNHLQSVDDQTQTLKINNIQDRQELATHDQAIKDNQRDITNNVAALQQTNADVTKNAGNIAGNRTLIGDNAKGIADNKTSIDNNALAIHNTDNHLQSVDNLAHNLNINKIQDRQELAAHDQAIKDNQRDITNNVAALQQTNANVTKNAGNIAGNRTLIGDNAKGIVTNKDAIQHNSVDVAKNTSGIATNKTSIDNLTVQNRTTYNLAADASRMSIHEEQEIVTLTQDTKVAQATGEYAQSRAQTAMQNAEKNRAALVATNKKVAANSAELTNHEQRIETLEQSNSASFGKLKSEVEDNRKRASAGIAGVAAMANIPQVTNTQNFSVGAGVGNSDGENALAVGFSARATENVVVKASVSDDSQHNFVVGGGIAYGW